MASRYARPRIAWAAVGLFHALQAEAAGDDAPLRAWMDSGFPALRESLRRAGLRGERSDDAATAVLERAYAWFRTGHAVANERAWMAKVAVNYAADMARAERRFQAPPLSLRGCFEPAPVDLTETAAAHRLADAVFRLPPPYREAMAFQKIEGGSRRAVLTLLRRWRRVGEEGARYILREGHRMLRFALEGGHPRDRWPQRYPPLLHNPDSRPTLPPGELRLLLQRA